ncbi:MAG: hypothetical protein JOZ41_17320 [Chloroflexi bacterium]|nr:hypothetical protein [Chloroflexota bacterium]
MSTQRDSLRDELAALLAARQELSAGDEQYLIESFLDHVEGEIDRRSRERVAGRLPQGRGLRRPEWRGGSATNIVAAAIALLVLALLFLGAVVHQPTAGLAVFISVVGILILLPLTINTSLDRARERRYIAEEESWLGTGALPPLVVRTYTTDGIFQRDASRLYDLGYRIETQQRFGNKTKVTYARV